MSDAQTLPAIAGQIDLCVRQLRLYVVRVVREAYVLAADETDAEDMLGDIDRWEDARVGVGSGSERLAGWDDRSMVYHAGKTDITLADARRAFPAA